MCALFAAFTLSCGSKKPKKTIENIKAAIASETNAGATYQAFSANATEAGYPNISKMFTAAVASAAIHVKNHNAVLIILGEEEFIPIHIGTPTIRTPINNIQAAIDGETYKYMRMYPDFIATANDEKCDEVFTAFSWTCAASAAYTKLYAQAREHLLNEGEGESDEWVASVWYVCPKCGNLFNTVERIDKCPLCAVPSSTFLQF
jgi:rubrerythrin